MFKQDLIRAAFASVDRSLRAASVAEIGGFRPPVDPLTSWFGGNFSMGREEPWPSNAHGPLLPLLQVLVSDLPEVPPPLRPFALIQVFIDNSELPLDLPASNGSGWLLKTYDTLQDLAPKPCPPSANMLRPFPVQWRLSSADAPSWDDAWGDDRSHDAFVELGDAIDLFHDRYKGLHRTKVGGWPSWIQSSFPGGRDFVMQITSEEKPRWMAGDNGNLYIFHEDGQWRLVWDCY